MRILRQVGIYSLVYQLENKSLKYYIDNGDEVSEYMDEYLYFFIVIVSLRSFV